MDVTADISTKVATDVAMDVTVVSHDGAPYPVLIADTDHDDIQVKCMHVAQNTCESLFSGPCMTLYVGMDERHDIASY